MSILALHLKILTSDPSDVKLNYGVSLLEDRGRRELQYSAISHTAEGKFFKTYCALLKYSKLAVKI